MSVLTERAYWSRIGMELACAVVAGLILAGLPGCATTTEAEPEARVCFLQLLGRTESGLSVVRQACLTEEQFAETQK
jgi:hypothetical protein